MSTLSSYLATSHLRIKHLGVLLLVVFAIFIARLFYIQVIQHSYYAAEAQKNQVTKLTIFPERGLLYARDGETIAPLVLNETVYTVFADPKEVDDAAAVKEALTSIAGGDILSGAFDGLSNTKSRYVVLARQVSRTQAELIQKKELAGVGLQKGTRRVYPEGALAGQLLGFVDTEGKGQYGVESYLNDRLSGQVGLLQAVSDVRRIPLTIGNDTIERSAVNGDNLVLTIDRNIQEYAEQVLQENAEHLQTKNASIVIMNPNNGQVMAMANYPTYEPANYSKTTDYSLFQNTVVSGPYEAGSVIKALTVAAGLDAGVITPTSTSPNPNGCTTVADRKICNVIRTVGPSPTTQDLLTFSLNTGAVNVLRSMGGGEINYNGRQKLHTYLTDRYRFTKQTGVEQASEAVGLLYSPDDEQGNNVRYANMTFGQGMTTTMIQVASAFSATINGGTYYRPTLVYGTREQDGSVKKVNPTVVQENVIVKQHSDEMRDLLWHARYDRTGRLTDRAGYRVGGKTGTSEVIDPTTGMYTSDHTIGSYLGFGGGSTPEYVIMIRMDDAQGGVFAGSTTASQMFGTISNWLITYKNIPPVS